MSPAGWTNNGGTFTPGTGTVSFNGSSLQTVSGTTTFNNFTVSNANGVSMTSDNTVNGVLALTSGDITVANTKTLTMPSTGTSSGAFDAIGNVLRAGFVTGGSALSFGNPFNTVQVTAGAAPPNISVNLVKSVPAGGQSFPTAVKRTYTVTPSAGEFTATVRLHYQDSDLNGSTEGAGLNLFRFDGTKWQTVAQTANDSAANWVERSGVTTFSPWTMANATVPDAPTGATATAGHTKATVIFSAPASDGGSPITGYTVVSNPAGGVDTNVGTTALSHLVTGLTNGTAYTFTVTATNSAGTGPPSTPSNSVTPAPTVPDAPTGVTATAGYAKATVIFSGPPSDGGSPITGYTVSSNPAGGVDTNAGTMTLTHMVTGLTNGTPYTFTVKATNALGAGPASTPSNSVTPAPTAPDAPSGAIALAGNAKATVSFSPPAFDGGSPIGGYTVSSSPAGGADTDAGTTGLSHLVTGLSNGTTYTFTVTAANAVGTSAASAPSNAVTPLAPLFIDDPLQVGVTPTRRPCTSGFRA